MPSTEPIRVGVLGAGGRMGRTICAAVAAAPDLELVAAVDSRSEMREVPLGDRGESLAIVSDRSALVERGATVAVDFTIAEAAYENLEFCADQGLHAVCGTTGLDSVRLAALGERFADAHGPNCVIAPNFAISAVLMTHLATIAAPYFDNIEIIELHHDQKRDAPSGTAIATAHAIDQARAAAGSGPLGADPTSAITLEGARGARTEGGVQLHSVRLAGLVAHQEVLFGTSGQSLLIRQDSYDRTSFMPGVLLALRRVATSPGLTIGLEGLLGL